MKCCSTSGGSTASARGSSLAPGRKKGAGTSARAVPLTNEAVEALREFIACNAFGPFSHSSLWKTFSLARDAALEKYPKDRAHLLGLRPYDLRHSFGTALYTATGDIRATQLLMGHSRVEMTHRYTLGAVDQRLAGAIAAFDAAGGNPGGNFSGSKVTGHGRTAAPARAPRKRVTRATTA